MYSQACKNVNGIFKMKQKGVILPTMMKPWFKKLMKNFRGVEPSAYNAYNEIA